MNYYLLEEIGDSETRDYFDLPSRNKAVVDDAEDAESCCSDFSHLYEPVQLQTGDDDPCGPRIKHRIHNALLPTVECHHEFDDYEAESSKALNAMDNSDSENKLKNSVSESCLITSSSGVNRDDIAHDNRLFWEACMAQGYP
ncbi:unnamed protein product [Rhodiola kirilowii]